MTKAEYRIVIEELSAGYRVVLLRFDVVRQEWVESASYGFPNDRDHAEAIKLALKWKQAYRVEKSERIKKD